MLTIFLSSSFLAIANFICLRFKKMRITFFILNHRFVPFLIHHQALVVFHLFTFCQIPLLFTSPTIEMLKEAMENNNVAVSETAEWLDDEEALARICRIR